MRGLLRIVALPLLLWAPPSAGLESPLFGLWLTESQRAIVRIHPCNEASEAIACGRIVWLQEPRDAEGRIKTDRMNPNEERRDDPLCSVQLIQAFRRQEDGAWTGGSIYNPRDGQSYAAAMRLEGDRLLLRGYVLLPVFGRSQTWTRVADDRGGCETVDAGRGPDD